MNTNRLKYKVLFLFFQLMALCTCQEKENRTFSAFINDNFHDEYRICYLVLRGWEQYSFVKREQKIIIDSNSTVFQICRKEFNEDINAELYFSNNFKDKEFMIMHKNIIFIFEFNLKLTTMFEANTIFDMVKKEIPKTNLIQDRFLVAYKRTGIKKEKQE